MRITISVFAHMAREDGTTWRAKGIAGILSKRHEVRIIDKPASVPTSETSAGVPNPLGLPKALSIVAPSDLGLVRKSDLVYCCNDFIRAPLYAALLRDVRMVYEAHSIAGLESRQRMRSSLLPTMYATLETTSVRKAHLSIALSSRIASNLRRTTDRVEIVSAFVDTSRFRRMKEATELRSGLGLEGQFVVGVLGPFTSPRNAHTLEIIQARIGQFDPEVTFVAIGEGLPYRPHQPSILSLGYVNDLPLYLSLLDLLLVLPAFPTFGPLNKILQAMSCSVPVLTSPKGLVGLDLLTPGVDVLVTSEEAVVESLELLRQSPMLLNRVARAGRQSIERNYSYDVVEPRLQRAIERAAQ